MFRKIKDISSAKSELVTQENVEWLLFSLNDYLLDTDNGLFLSNKKLTFRQIEYYLKKVSLGNSINIYTIKKDNADIVEMPKDTYKEAEPVVDETFSKELPEDLPEDDENEIENTKDFYLSSHRKTGAKLTWSGWSEEKPELTKSRPYLWHYTYTYIDDSTEGKSSEPELIETFEVDDE